MKKKSICTVLASVLLCGCGSSQAAVQSASSADASAAPASYACRVMDYYDYSKPVPESSAVDDSYYDDVLMAGDSRMGSMYLYGTHKNAEIDYVTSVNFATLDVYKLDNDDTRTLMDVFNTTTKGNVYILLGINEIRNPSADPFLETYQNIITTLQTNNPKVNIYTILEYHPDEISGLPEPQLSDQLKMVNDGLINIAQNSYTYYLDTDNGLDDENGTIRDDYTYDGLHFTPDGTLAFQNYLDTHVVRSDTYVKEICE